MPLCFCVFSRWYSTIIDHDVEASILVRRMHKSIATAAAQAVTTVAIIISSKWMIGTLIFFSLILLLFLRFFILFATTSHFFRLPLLNMKRNRIESYKYEGTTQTNKRRNENTRRHCMIQHHLNAAQHNTSNENTFCSTGKQVSSPLCFCGWYDNLSFPFVASISYLFVYFIYSITVWLLVFASSMNGGEIFQFSKHTQRPKLNRILRQNDLFSEHLRR